MLNMNEKEPLELSEKELLAETKKTKSTPIINALLIGFMIGIIIFSIVKSTVGLFTLIPLYSIYKLVNGSKIKNELKKD